MLRSVVQIMKQVPEMQLPQLEIHLNLVAPSKLNLHIFKVLANIVPLIQHEISTQVQISLLEAISFKIFNLCLPDYLKFYIVLCESIVFLHSIAKETQNIYFSFTDMYNCLFFILNYWEFQFLLFCSTHPLFKFLTS